MKITFDATDKAKEVISENKDEIKYHLLNAVAIGTTVLCAFCVGYVKCMSDVIRNQK